MTGTSEYHKRLVQNYYIESHSAYSNWGKDEDRKGIYALHCGFHPDGIEVDQYESTKLMTQKIVEMADIQPGDSTLDAGFGTGSFLFEASEAYPLAEFHATNISPNQIEIAKEYQALKGLTNVQIYMQDFLQPGFADETFNTVVYFESLAHSTDKETLVEQTNRVLKPDGKVVVADAFFLKENLNSQEAKLKNWAESGWVLPPIPTIDELKQVFEHHGFSIVNVENITKNILPSTARMAAHAQMRLNTQDQDPNSQMIKSRYACIAADILMKDQVLGYFFITTQKC